uniref:glycoside hydrolase family 16 protein n=1 Tax=Sphingomonas bacterium TaxID=1895847 RepID=UPI0015775080
LLDGYGGDDVLVGGPGADVFRIERGNGSDVIVGFAPGTDKLRLAGVALTSFAQVTAAARQVGRDTVIAIGGGETVTLRDVALPALSAGDVQLPIDLSAMTPTFRDEFDAFVTRDRGGPWLTDYGLGKPAYDHGLPGEAEVYVDRRYTGSGTRALGIDPFAIEPGGVLAITAAPVTAAARPWLGAAAYTSGVISTNHRFAQTYGYFEVRAALPAGQGFFPAFWLLPQSGAWPPEIDIVEALGQEPGVVHMTAHDQVDGRHVSAEAVTYLDDPAAMHRYGLNWTRAALAWYVDGVEVARQPTPASLRQPCYINLNLAVGGSWAGPPDATTGTGTMRIDYVRVYANADTVMAPRRP